MSFFGAALLGAQVRFHGPEESTARAVVAPAESVAAYGLPAGSQRVAYGAPPDEPSVAHFERDVWSENPSFPATVVPTDSPVLATEDGTYSHATLLDAAETVSERWELAPGDEVAVRAPLTDPRTLVAGVLAPLIAGGAILLPDDSAEGESRVGGFAVSDDDAPEESVLALADVPLSV